jgi:hypothetical protein
MTPSPSSETTGQLEAAWNKLWSEFIGGIRHGHFSFTLHCQITNAGAREVIFEAGKHHRFVIQKHEICSQLSRDPRHGDTRPQQTASPSAATAEVKAMNRT